MLMVVCVAVAKTQGADVELRLTSGSIVRGELVSVTDTAIVICPHYGKCTRPGVRSRDSVVELTSIVQYTVFGSSPVLQKMGMGMLVGGGVGALIGLASGDDPPGFLSFSAGQKAMAVGLMLGLAGGIGGLIVGIANSTPDVVLIPLPGDRFDALRPYSRFVRE